MLKNYDYKTKEAIEITALLDGLEGVLSTIPVQADEDAILELDKESLFVSEMINTLVLLRDSYEAGIVNEKMEKSYEAIKMVATILINANESLEVVELKKGLELLLSMDYEKNYLANLNTVAAMTHGVYIGNIDEATSQYLNQVQGKGV